MSMNILILGAPGFIGTNLAIKLAKTDCNLFLYGRRIEKEFKDLFLQFSNVKFLKGDFGFNEDFEKITKNIDVVYHLISSTIPASSDKFIFNEDIKSTIKLLHSMVKNKCKRIVFISSGGAIYGNAVKPPFNEDSVTNPISIYGIQKLTIEKYLYLYNYQYGLEYKIIRLSNPYGTYQRANTGQGVMATFINRVLNNEELVVYGDGEKIRDYIYIDDAIDGILNIANANSKYDLYNLGSGFGLSINDIIETIKRNTNYELKIKYVPDRITDVGANFLKIDRYINEFGNPININIDEGVRKTFNYWREKIIGR